MHLCYLDESGDAGLFSTGDRTACPVFVVAACIIDHNRLPRMTHDFLRIKGQFFPNLNTSNYLDSIQMAVKGAKVREDIRKGSRRNRSHAIGYLDKIADLMEKHHMRLLAKALIKGAGLSNSDAGFYGSAIMHVCEHFQAYLHTSSSLGQLIADSRRKAQNTRTTHTIFTQMHRVQGNSYPNLVEMPTYGHAENHAMLQITDTICSGILFPMLTDAYCNPSDNAHVTPQYTTIRNRYKNFIKAIQHRYQDANGYWRGGIMINDATGQHRNAALLFN